MFVKQIDCNTVKENITRSILELLPDWFGIPEAGEMGYSFVQVKTVQMGRYDIYDDTNRFYLSLGFQELEVFPTLWDERNPCQIYIMSIDRQVNGR